MNLSQEHKIITAFRSPAQFELPNNAVLLRHQTAPGVQRHR